MKKLICTLLIFLLLAGCTNSPAPTVPSDSTQSTTAPTVTQPPVTEPPVTEPPVTEPPVTNPPVTEPPVTDPTDDPSVDPPFEEPPFVAHESFDATACAPLKGTWSTTITLSGALQNLEMFTERTSFQLYYTFDENGYFRAWADQTEFDKAIDDFEAMVIDHMVDLRFITFKGPLEYQGVDDEEIEARWINGPEAEARLECAESVAALNLYHRFKRLLREGQYYVSGGKLYTQLSEDSFESNGYAVSAEALDLRNTNNMSIYRDICINFPVLLMKSE